jgi:adenine-specific DNA-methyltransferase
MAKKPVKVETLTHDSAARRNIPTAEYQSVAERIEEQNPTEPAHYQRARPLAEGETRERDEDLDPQIMWQGARIRVSKEQARRLLETGEIEIGDAQLVWRGKDRQDWSDLVVPTPPIYIQEKVHPKAIIDDLERRKKEPADQADMFADINGLDDPEARTEFYQHDQHWSNRFILGDSLAVMASLAEREGLRGKVQCIYFDPPYGIKFNSNWQVSTLSRDVKDGKQHDVSREPEQIKAFRDTWKDGIHSYLTYLRDRLTVARELLTESGSIFVQIGDENVHRIRALLEEVLGSENVIVNIPLKKKGGQKSNLLDPVNDYIVWAAKSRSSAKYRQLYEPRLDEAEVARDFRLAINETGEVVSLSQAAQEDNVGNLYEFKPFKLEENRTGWHLFTSENITSGGYRKNQSVILKYKGRDFDPGISRNNCWKHTAVAVDGKFSGMDRLAIASRLYVGANQLRYVRHSADFGIQPVSNWWDRFGGAKDPLYVVQTMSGWSNVAFS